MARNRSAADDMVTLSADDMARFHRCAPAALAGRGAGFVGESLTRALELVVMGAVPIVGTLWFEWSAAQQLAFLLAGAWVGIVCDIARISLAERAVLAFGQTHYDDWHVWLVTGALRKNTNRVYRAHLMAKWDPWMGVFVDLAAGGIATVIILLMVFRGGGIRAEPGAWLDRKLLLSLACMAGYQGLMAAWDIKRHRTGGAEAGPLKATPGMRGLGLFLLVFVVAYAGDAESKGGMDAGRVMMVVNGAIVAMGIFNAVGLLWLRGDTRWLRAYVAEHRAEVEAAIGSGVAGKRAKKKRK